MREGQNGHVILDDGSSVPFKELLVEHLESNLQVLGSTGVEDLL